MNPSLDRHGILDPLYALQNVINAVSHRELHQLRQG